MSESLSRFLQQHANVSRRYFLGLGAAGATALAASQPLLAQGGQRDPKLEKAIADLETWLTEPDAFRDVSRGRPKPHSLSDEKRQEVGLTRETWKLEVVSDPENKARIRNPLTAEKNTAFDFKALMTLAETHAVRFAKVMTCLNIGCPLGTGIWEGVPLREVLWLTQPTENLRRVFYYGYHNDDPRQMFRSSLPVGRILEDPWGLPPVILCYKLNGQWLTPERGGPVRVVVPETYGFKSIKWLSHVFLSNLFHANDTYGEQNNDVDSPLKTFAATLSVPTEVKAGQSFAVTGYGQVGIAGLSRVQVWLRDKSKPLPENDPHFTSAPWVDAEILPAPQSWGGGLPEGRIPANTMGFDDQGRPQSWPLRLARIQWAVMLPPVPAGDYEFRCRTVDAQGVAQPMPRPFRKSGHAAIEKKDITVS